MSVTSCIAVFSFLVSVCFVWGDWTQQYGDYRSTNYAEIDPTSDLFNVTQPWNYTYPGPYSYFYNSPAVAETGMVFLPFLRYAPPKDGVITYDLQVRAASPNGSIVWVAANLGVDFSCAVIFLTNAVYISAKKMVMIGWTCAAAFPYYQKHGQLLAMDSMTGKILWKSKKLYDANDLSRLSVTSDVAYVSGGYDCSKDGLPLKSAAGVGNTKEVIKERDGHAKIGAGDEHQNISRIYAFNVNDGSMIWVRNYSRVGCTSQTRIYPLGNDKHMVIFPVNLPDNVYLGGKLLALECDSKGVCTDKWLSDAKICWDTTFAFSDDQCGVLFGGYGFDGIPDLIFGLDIKTGKKVFSNMGHCEVGVYPSGPAVDEMGHAYYSCGNRVFAVDSKGDLLWKTDLDQTAGYIFYSDHRFPPAIVPTPDKSNSMLVTMNTNSTHLYGLFANNGSIAGSTPVPVLDGDVGVSEPPFVAGNRIFWIKVHYYTKFYLFSIPLSALFN